MHLAVFQILCEGFIQTMDHHFILLQRNGDSAGGKGDGIGQNNTRGICLQLRADGDQARLYPQRRGPDQSHGGKSTGKDLPDQPDQVGKRKGNL